jgi:hypothetical protein
MEMETRPESIVLHQAEN